MRLSRAASIDENKRPAKAAEIRVGLSRTDCGLQYELYKMKHMSALPGQAPDLVARVTAGDWESIVELRGRYRARLRRVVALRLDPRLQGRVDVLDVIQEGCLDAIRRLESILGDLPGDIGGDAT